MEEKIKTIVLVCCHKDSFVVNESPYVPIHVGAALHQDLELEILRDDSGDNISNKNGSYCELTGLYWAWKHIDNYDIIGLCHYRRYFDFHSQNPHFIPSFEYTLDEAKLLDYSIPNKYLRRVSSGAVVLARPINYRRNLMEDYCVAHISTDYRIMERVICETCDEPYITAFKQVMFDNRLSHYNMFLMNKESFHDYSEWLFTILSKIEKEVNITSYDIVQKRIFGYMAERLLNVWVVAKNKKIIYRSVIRQSDKVQNERRTFFYSIVRPILNNIGIWLLKSHK